MVNVKNNAASVETRGKLLEAAGEVFAQHGFRRATVRQIADIAGVNAAAINYHFRDKEELYAAALQHAHCVAKADILALSPEGPAEQRLRTFIRLLLHSVLNRERPQWHSQLMVLEMTEPTKALDAVVETAIRPQRDYVEACIRELLGPRFGDAEVRNCVGSVMGQCLFHRICQPVIRRLHPELVYSAEQIEQLSQHIAAFSLGALRALRAQREGRP